MATVYAWNIRKRTAANVLVFEVMSAESEIIRVAD